MSTQTEPFSVGLLGLSHLHPRSYMPLFQAAGFRVAAAADANSAVLEAFLRDFPVRGYAGWREMIAKESLDLAVLFLPHCECPEAAVACAQRGIHILAEKPMAATSQGARLMLEAARKAGVILSTPYVWRCHPVARQMKTFAQSPALGRIVRAEGRCIAGRARRYVEGNSAWMLRKDMSGGGAMHNLGVHWIDLYRWILDDEVVEAIGRMVTSGGDYDVEDSCQAILTFSRGTALTLDVGYIAPDCYPSGRDLYLAMYGSAGAVSWNPSFEGVKESLFLYTDAREFASSPRQRIEFELPARQGYAGICGLRFLEELADAIRTSSPPAVSGEDGVKALEVVEMIYESAA